MDDQMTKWVLQSTSDEAFFGMTEEEFDERCNRLAFKTLNGIIDEEVVAADRRAIDSIVKLYGEDRANEIKRLFAIR
jgi:hypothetical protein